MIRPCMWPVALWSIALWVAIATAELPYQTASSPQALATIGTQPTIRSLFLPPAARAAEVTLPPSVPTADIDPNGPHIYRLPRVVPPPRHGDQSEGDQFVDDRPSTHVPVPPPLPVPMAGPPANGNQSDLSVDDPIPEALDLDVDVDAPAKSEDLTTHHDTSRAHAADDHPSDVDAAGGPPVGPAVEAGVLPYTPTAVELTTQLLPAVQHACSLAQRGAMYAAQTEFVQVLRRIAQAKDAQLDTDEHARALAAGLRALDEADDFVPRGTQLEAELVVGVVASSHRTPVLAGGAVDVRPQEAVALYLSYAQQQLARAVAGQQAGSMVLHSIGRLYSRLAECSGDIQQVRKAMTMYLAALEACPQNHLAANELGVLLAHNGHYAEAEAMFRRAVAVSPSATGYHNLAVVQRKLNQPQQAIANQQQADRLAAWERANGEVSRRKGVQWVAPDELARAAGQPPTPTEPAANDCGPQPAATTASPPFAPPPLKSDAPDFASSIPAARPYAAQTQSQTW